MLGGVGPDVVQCSRAGCRESATSAVHWRNPSLHGPERVKTWTACEEHLPYLREFLRARDFPVAVTAVGESVQRVGDEGPEAR